jgi:hypothetical protein
LVAILYFLLQRPCGVLSFPEQRRLRLPHNRFLARPSARDCMESAVEEKPDDIHRTTDRVFRNSLPSSAVCATQPCLGSRNVSTTRNRSGLPTADCDANLEPAEYEKKNIVGESSQLSAARQLLVAVSSSASAAVASATASTITAASTIAASAVAAPAEASAASVGGSVRSLFNHLV